MRRDWIFARIVLVLSVVHLALAAPGVVRQRYLDTAEDVTTALEKRVNSYESLVKRIPLPPQSPSSMPVINEERSLSSSQPGSSSGSPQPGSSSGSPPSELPTSETPSSQDDPHAGSADLHSAVKGYPSSPWSPSLPVINEEKGLASSSQPGPSSGAPPSEDNRLPTPGTPSSQDDTDAGSGSLHSDETAVKGVPSPPPSGTSQLHSDQPSTSGALPSQDNPHAESGTPELHDDSPVGSGVLQSHDDLPSGSKIAPYRWWEEGESSTSGALRIQNDPPPTGTSPSQVHNDVPTEPDHSSYLSHSHFDSSWRWINDVHPVETERPESPSAPPEPEPEPEAEADKFFTEELKQKMKDYAVLGTIAGISTGLINGVQKEIMGTLSPGAETIGRDLASSELVGRGAGQPLYDLPDHFQARKTPVSRGLAKLRDEDLRLLSFLTRRALESLD